MRPRAFLLCPDQKAVEAISHVLSDMDVSSEQLQDAELAVQRVTTQRYDAIVIDCDDEKAAAPVLQAIRQSAANQSVMTIAVCDGKTGVPNAFRLGAALVLTKPVSVEQTRNTIRTALAMRRKAEAKPTPPAPVPSAAPLTPKFENQVAKSAPTAPMVSRPAAPAITMSPTPPAKHTVKPAEAEHASLATMPTPAQAKPSKPISLKRDEVDEFEAAEYQEKSRTQKLPAVPTFAALGKPRRSANPYSIAALVLLLVAAGGYFAFSMNPAFHELALQQFSKVYTLATGKALRPTTAAIPVHPAKPATPVPPTMPVKTAALPEGFAAADAVAASVPKAAPAPATTPVVLSTSATTSTTSAEPPLTVADDLADKHVSSRVIPVYPDRLRRKGIAGDVVLQVSVSKEGSVDTVEAVSGNPQLATAASDAVKQWHYETYYHNGQPSPFQTQVTIHFGAAAKQ